MCVQEKRSLTYWVIQRSDLATLLYWIFGRRKAWLACIDIDCKLVCFLLPLLHSGSRLRRIRVVFSKNVHAAGLENILFLWSGDWRRRWLNVIWCRILGISHLGFSRCFSLLRHVSLFSVEAWICFPATAVTLNEVLTPTSSFSAFKRWYWCILKGT